MVTTLVGRQRSAQKVAVVGVSVNIVLTLFKAILGVLSGSTAVIADAFHSASDIAASGIVYIGVRLAGSPPDETHHYGHAKLESVAAKIVSLILVVTGVGLGLSAWGVLRSGSIQVPTSLAIWATAVSIVVKETLYRYVHGIGNRLNSTALLAEAWHHRSDAISSVAALIGVTGAMLGFPAFDALAGITVAILIGHMGVKLYVQSVRELIDEAPQEAVIEGIRTEALKTPGVLNVSEVKARNNGPVVLVDLKLCVNRFLTVEQGHDIASKAKRNILSIEPAIDNVLVHVNPCHHVSDVQEIPDCDACGNSPHTGHNEEADISDRDNTSPGLRNSNW